MKKITKPAEREEAVFYSDFSGKTLGDLTPPVELKIEFNYGSERDGASLQLHLDDEDVKPIVELIKQKMSADRKKQLKKQLEEQEKSFEDSMQFRDWNSCDYITNSMWFLRELLDLKED
ncbi:MAG: hypothetical protein ACO3EY_05415 [Candidatus Nanopelagicales bacterium]